MSRIRGVISSYEGAITTDTPIGRMAVAAAAPKFKMHVEVVAPIKIAFALGTPCVNNKSVLEVLGGIYNFVVSDVFPRLSGFL